MGLYPTLFTGLCQRRWATFSHFLSNRGRHLTSEAQILGNSVERARSRKSQASAREGGRAGARLLGPAARPMLLAPPALRHAKDLADSLGREEKGTNKLGDITGEAGEARKGMWAEAWESKTHRPGVVFRAALSSSNSSNLPHGPSTPLAGAPQIHSSAPLCCFSFRMPGGGR